MLVTMLPSRLKHAAHLLAVDGKGNKNSTRLTYTPAFANPGRRAYRLFAWEDDKSTTVTTADGGAVFDLTGRHPVVQADLVDLYYAQTKTNDEPAYKHLLDFWGVFPIRTAQDMSTVPESGKMKYQNMHVKITQGGKSAQKQRASTYEKLIQPVDGGNNGEAFVRYLRTTRGKYSNLSRSLPYPLLVTSVVMDMPPSKLKERLTARLATGSWDTMFMGDGKGYLAYRPGDRVTTSTRSASRVRSVIRKSGSRTSRKRARSVVARRSPRSA